MGVIQPSSPHRRLAQLLREHIEIGLYPPGVRMPGMTKLADQYGVKPAVVRNALVLLRLEGIICARNGDGHYVTPDEDRGDSENARLVNATRAVVYATGARTAQIAERTGVSRWHIQRMLGGGRLMTPEWSQRIIKAARDIGREEKRCTSHE